MLLYKYGFLLNKMKYFLIKIELKCKGGDSYYKLQVDIVCWELSSILIDERVWKWFLNDTVERNSSPVLTTVVSIHIGYSRTEMKKSINAQNKIEPANLPKTMVSHVLVLFRKNTPLVQWDKLVYLIVAS